MRKLIILFAIALILMASLVSAIIKTEVKISGIKTIYIMLPLSTRWNDSFMELRNYTLGDSATGFKENCSCSRANDTYMNYSRLLCLSCHLGLNETINGCRNMYQNITNFTDVSFYFDFDSPMMSKNYNAIQLWNNSGLLLKNVNIDFASSFSDYKNLLIGMPPDIMFYCDNDIRQFFIGGDTTEVCGNTTETFEGVSLHGYKVNITKSDDPKLWNSQSLWVQTMFYNLTANFTSFYNVAFGSPSYPSRINKLSFVQSYLKNSLKFERPYDGFHLYGSEYVNLDRSVSKYCFFPILGMLYDSNFDNAWLQCGNQFIFGAYAYGFVNFTDSKVDTVQSGGLIADIQVIQKYTLNQNFKDNNNKSIMVNYSVCESGGSCYTGVSNNISLKIISSVYNNVDGTFNYQPILYNYTNTSYFPIRQNGTMIREWYSDIPFINISEAQIINVTNTTNVTNIFNNQPIEYKSNQSDRGIDTMFIVMLSVSLIFIGLGFFIREHTELAIIGFFLMFMLSVSMLVSGINYKVGENLSVSYEYQNESIGQLNKTVVSSVDIYQDVTFNSGMYRTFAWYSAIASAFGMIIVIYSIGRKKE